MKKSQSGIGLTILVIIIAIGGIVIGSSVHVFQSMARQTQLRIDQTKAHYLAQAGVMRAAWNWYVVNTTVEGSRRKAIINTTVTGNQIFKVGMDSNGAYLQSNYAYVAPISHTGIALAANIGTAQSKAVSGTLVRTLTVGVTQGDLIVVNFAIDNLAGAVTCADTGGNTYATAADVTNAAGVRTVILYAIAETALIATNTITITHPNATPAATARAMSARSFTGANRLDSTATATGATNAPASGPAARAHWHELLIGAHGMEGPNADAFTQGAGWTTSTKLGTTGGAADTNVTIHPQYRIQNDAATYTAGGTNTTSARDWASAEAIFYGAAHWYTPPATANRRLRAWRIQNVNSTAGNNITLTHIKVSWTGGGAAALTEIRLNNTSVWTGSATTGTTVDITDTALAGAGASWSGINTYLQWDTGGPTDPTTVTCQFIFNVVAPATSSNSDANTHEVVMWNGAHSGAGLPHQRTFVVNSTGQVNQVTNKYFKVLKTVKATKIFHEIIPSRS